MMKRSTILVVLVVSLCLIGECCARGRLLGEKQKHERLDIGASIERVIDQHYHDRHLHLPHRYESESINVLESSPHAQKNHSCNECVRWVAHHTITETVEVIKKYCENTTCPEVKKHCEWMKEHSNFTLGYLVGKLRPIAFGYVYCAGRGSCPIHPNDTQITVSMAELLQETSDWDSQYLEILNTDSSDLSVAFSQHDDSDDDDDDDDDDDGNDDPSKEKCQKCIMKGTATVVTYIFKGINDFCEKTKDEKWKERCEWTASHKEFSTGYIVATQKPQHYAVGYCFGIGECDQSSAPKSTYRPVEPFQI